MSGRLGLTAGEAARRLSEIGPNEIPRQAGPSRLAVLAGQFGSPLVWLLLGACLVSGLLGELADAIAIGVIVVVNAVVGYVQEWRAEGALLALRAMTAPRARVRRDGQQAVWRPPKWCRGTCSSSRRATWWPPTPACWKRTCSPPTNRR